MGQCEARSQTLNSGPLVLEPGERRAWLEGKAIHLSAMPQAILQALLAANGQVVTRAELKETLWPYAQRIDTEHRLNTGMRALREALGDTAAQPRLIETLRGHGYRWIGKDTSVRQGNSHLRIATAVLLAFLAASPAALVISGTASTNGASSPVDPSWRSAEAAYRTELHGNPGSVAARRALAWMYVNDGRTADALPHIASLLQAGARTPSDKAEFGWLLLRSEKPEAALAECSGDGETSLNMLSCRQTALSRLGLIDQARSAAVELMRAAHADKQVIRSVAMAPAKLGYANFLRWRIAVFVRPNRDWFQRAQLQADAGMYPQALASLKRAAAARDPLLVKIGSSAEFAPLRRAPDYQRIASAVLTKTRIS